MPMIDQVIVTFLFDDACICFVSTPLSLDKSCFIILLVCIANLIAMVVQGEKDDKIIAVCADDPEYRHFKDIKELPPHRLAEIRRFFEDCEAH